MKKIIGEIIKYGFWGFMIICLAILFGQRVQGKDPTLFNHTIYVILTDSMTGEYEVDDIILVKHVDPEKIEQGDVITYHAVEGPAAGMTITHKVVKKPIVDENGKYIFQTRGVKFGATDDPPVSEENVVGRVVGKLHMFTFVYHLFKSPAGFIVILLVAGTMIVLYSIFAKKESKEEKASDEKATTN